MSDEGEVFETNEGVRIVMPDGTTEGRTSLSLADLLLIAREAGIRKFVAKKDGVSLGGADFPVTTGILEVIEYNEAK